MKQPYLDVPFDQIKKYEENEIKVILAGKGDKVDLRKLMPLLKSLEIDTILLEGGGNLNWSFIEYDLVDEIRITVAPLIVGGMGATSLVEGIGFNKMGDAPKFKLLKVSHRNNYVVLKYRRLKR